MWTARLLVFASLFTPAALGESSAAPVFRGGANCCTAFLCLMRPPQCQSKLDFNSYYFFPLPQQICLPLHFYHHLTALTNYHFFFSPANSLKLWRRSRSLFFHTVIPVSDSLLIFRFILLPLVSLLLRQQEIDLDWFEKKIRKK